MIGQANKSLAVVVACAFLWASCASFFKEQVRDIPEDKTGQISFITADEETGKLAGGVTVEVYQAGRKAPFRTFATDKRGPIQLTHLAPGEYTLVASEMTNPDGTRSSITGTTTHEVVVRSGQCQEITQILESSGNQAESVGLIIGIVLTVGLILLIASAGGAAGGGGLGLCGSSPVYQHNNVRSTEFQKVHHRQYEYSSRFYDQIDLGGAPVPSGGLLVLPIDIDGTIQSVHLSPDLPLIKLVDLSMFGAALEADQVTIKGAAKSIRGIRQVWIGNRCVYRAPPAVAGQEPLREIEFEHTHPGLVVGENVIRIKAIDQLFFSAEIQTVVVMSDSSVSGGFTGGDNKTRNQWEMRDMKVCFEACTETCEPDIPPADCEQTCEDRCGGRGK